MYRSRMNSNSISTTSDSLDSIESAQNGAKSFTKDVQSMSALQMVMRQLTICRLQKNVDPTWKRKAIDTLPPILLWFYVASSFCYTAGGIVLLARADQLSNVTDNADWFPWIAFGIYLVLQGIVTTLSDVTYVDRPSVWHPIDRSFALVGIIFTVLSLSVLLANRNVRENHAGGLAAVVLGTFLSFFAFAMEWKYKAKENIQAFVFCHTLWHTLGPAGYIGLVLSL